MNLDNIKSVHFIGIGGIGISAIARMMLLGGKEITGSDRSPSIITDELASLGAKISIGESADNLNNVDLVIYTIAISEDSPEMIKAKELNIPILSYPEVLGIISKDKVTISISGTHGKTTTTAMIGKVMIDAGLDPTVIVGSLMTPSTTLGSENSRSNLVVGKSKFLVVESCEYRRSFLNINPKIIIITNIDNDHLDYYKDFEDIQSAFSEFVSKLGPEDYLITDVVNENILSVVKTAKCKVIDYQSFGHLVSKLRLKVIGRHNIENAKAVLALVKVLNIDEESAIKSLNSFSGTWRRFEFKGVTPFGAEVYDDYGHHPTEIRATLKATREHFGEKWVTAIFQPHLYSRTKLLLEDFARSFVDADELILLPIYSAREADDKSISSEILAKEIADNLKDNSDSRLKSIRIAHDHKEAISLIPKSAEIIITIGAGDVTNISTLLTK